MKIVLSKIRPNTTQQAYKKRKKNKLKLELEAKAMTVNAAWLGRRFKTGVYKTYEEELSYLLTKYKKGQFKTTDKLKVSIVFYFRQAGGTDVDNLLKPLLDILVKNNIIPDDRFIYELTAKKILIEKGKQGRIKIEIEKI